MAEDHSRLDRLEAAIDRQFALNAELRTALEIQRQEATELRTTAEALLQIVQLHQQDIMLIATEFRRHRSDGHVA